MPSLSTPETAELKRLAGDPEAQAAYAVTLLRPKAPLAALLAALAVLERNPQPAARPGLLAVYAHYDADGPRRDAGCVTSAGRSSRRCARSRCPPMSRCCCAP